MSLAHVFFLFLALSFSSERFVDGRLSGQNPHGLSGLSGFIKKYIQGVRRDIGRLRSEQRKSYKGLTEQIQALQSSVNELRSETSTNGTLPQIIHVGITVTDNGVIGPSLFNQTWNATANKGDSMFVVLKKLQLVQRSFNFTYTMYSFGAYVTGFVGIEADSDLQQYWAFLKYPNIYMPTGVSDTYPSNGDSYIFNATTY